jgi:16S rRNA (guanine527-N7)-methyltransferase
LGLKLTVHANRIQDLEPQHADVVSARALAPLEDLCAYAASHLNAGGVCAFPKGASAQEEIETARTTWSFNIDQVASITDSRASVLFLKDLKRV